MNRRIVALRERLGRLLPACSLPVLSIALAVIVVMIAVGVIW